MFCSELRARLLCALLCNHDARQGSYKCLRAQSSLSGCTVARLGQGCNVVFRLAHRAAACHVAKGCAAIAYILLLLRVGVLGALPRMGSVGVLLTPQLLLLRAGPSLTASRVYGSKPPGFGYGATYVTTRVWLAANRCQGCAGNRCQGASHVLSGVCCCMLLYLLCELPNWALSHLLLCLLHAL